MKSSHSHAQYLERRALDGELNRWGKWIERYWDSNPYSALNILASHLQGSGGTLPGSKILCLEMPTGIYAVHVRILRLHYKLQEAVWLRFAIRVAPDGTLWSEEERCLKLGISERTFRRRLEHARKKLLGLPSNYCKSGQEQVSSGYRNDFVPEIC